MAKQTKQELVYQHIYDKIFNSEYIPGASLTEEGLCAELNVSRTPVREAIHRLISEGLLEVTPGIGLSVAKIHLEDLLEIYELRDGLEQMATKLFMEKKNTNAVDELTECISLQKEALEKNEIELFMQNDMKFHRIISRGASNHRLTAILDSLYAHIHRMANYVRTDPEVRRDAVTEHQKILDGILAKDINAALQATEEHCQSGKRYYLKQLYNI